MKTFIKAVSLIMIMLAINVCGLNKSVQRQKHQRSISENVAIRTMNDENITGTIVRELRDSSGQVYQLTIFPVDTIQFSVENGFKGKASKIELRGKGSDVRKRGDSVQISASGSTSTEIRAKQESHESQFDRGKVVERKGIKWWWWVVVVIVIVPAFAGMTGFRWKDLLSRE